MSTETKTPTTAMTRIGYTVLAKRPGRSGATAFDYDSAGSIWPRRGPCENHQAYCQGRAEDEPGRYGHVEYVIAELTLSEDVTP